ncbi:MAG: alpha/beta fold hydrolase [Chloroflexi bacterium]|nr:alpha/beta fold hydrolase [Chloroflexota bacterium]
MQTYDIDLPGLGRTRYGAAGSGPPVVLLHGLGATHVIWRPNAGPLAEQYAVYAPDFPGHGGSRTPGVRYSLAAGVRFVVTFMDALGLRRAVLVGSSMGGLVALAVAARHPEMVAGLALASPAGLGRDVSLAMRLAALPVAGPLLARLAPSTGEGFLPSLFYRPEAIDPHMVAEINAMASAPGIQDTALAVLRSSVGLGGLRRDVVQLQALKQATCPVLIVWGKEDRILPVTHAFRAQAAQPLAEVHVLPECGHLPNVEKAQEFNQMVLEFAGRVCGAAGDATARSRHGAT